MVQKCIRRCAADGRGCFLTRDRAEQNQQQHDEPVGTNLRIGEFAQLKPWLLQLRTYRSKALTPPTRQMGAGGRKLRRPRKRSPTRA
eukprot:650750-Pleurochrysis_carterae.AAC.1